MQLAVIPNGFIVKASYFLRQQLTWKFSFIFVAFFELVLIYYRQNPIYYGISFYTHIQFEWISNSKNSKETLFWV